MFKLIKNNLTVHKIKYIIFSVSILFSFSLMAQQNNVTTTENTVFSNTLFNILLALIVLLLIIIAVLANVLKNVAEATKDKYMKNKSLMIGTIIGGLLLSSNDGFAQQASSANTYMGLSPGMFYLLIAIIGFELIIIAVLITCIQIFIKKEEVITVTKAAKPAPSIFEKLNASVAVEEEAGIMMDHEYDGIRELDNNLPPWWKYGFYFTILWGFVYLVHYHVTRTGDLQTGEYNKSIVAANIAKEEYQKLAKNNITESNVVMLSDAAEIEKGGTIYKEVCSACHGNAGEGGVGPNLTDDYWIHGGSIKDIFISIKYGWPNKGMIAWQGQYSPSQIQQITSYIKTLRGTNPANAKEKQGDLYVEQVVEKVDSTLVDSAKVVIPAVDSSAVSKK